MEPEIDIDGNLLSLENCPQCGQPTWSHDKEQKHYVCIDDECGWVEDYAGESSLTRFLRLLRLKAK